MGYRDRICQSRHNEPDDGYTRPFPDPVPEEFHNHNVFAVRLRGARDVVRLQIVSA